MDDDDDEKEEKKNLKNLRIRTNYTVWVHLRREHLLKYCLDDSERITRKKYTKNKRKSHDGKNKL